nr:NADH dehydrogenase subunit 5 [Aphaenomurus interpositus]
MKVSYYISFMLLMFSLVSLFFSFLLLLNYKTLFIEWEVFSMNSFLVVMTLLFDWMSLMFMSLVMFISSMVLFYSNFYMGSDKNVYRFIMLVYLFVLSMLLLIISPNMISILLGWDGLGLVSYCLVIYYQNEKSANAGMLTVLSNRVGDLAILLSISWMLNFGSWNFYYFQYFTDFDGLMFIMFMVILAAMTKSAQIPFSAWLPAAMAAPTPVSSLVHSSTLVTAGVYLLIRFNELLGLNKFLFFISVMTMLMSGISANFEMDLKKIIALSTLSQLGVMMMTLSLGFYELSFFHLLSHALFKSLLFLCAGVMIHGMGDIQDVRYMGGVSLNLPVVSIYFMGSSLSLCGFPFLSGFYSKDLILEIYFMGSLNYLMMILIYFSMMLTLLYSFRLIYYMYFKNLTMKMMVQLSEVSGMYFPMMFLFIFSVVGGSLMKWLMFPLLYISMPFILKNIIIVGLFFFFFFGLMNFFTNNLILNLNFSMLKLYLGLMWFLPKLSTILLYPLLLTGTYFSKNFDQGWLEDLSVQYLYKKISLSSLKTDFFNNLNLKSYILIFFFILLSVVILM